MKLSFLLIASILTSLPLFSYGDSTNSPLDTFLQCLPHHIKPSNPISNSIYTPKNSSFQSIFTAYVKNLRILTKNSLMPLAIVTARHESHVQATVICAKSTNLHVRIRSGGHDYEGLSYTSTLPFIILDMFNLRSIEISLSSQSAWVQAGATLGELYYKISKSSKHLAFPAGVCNTIGVGGHFSGGGYGSLMRKYGLSIDNVVDAKLVDVKGRILDRESMGEDLFWAIRGGGGTSFGVILSWKIKLVQVPENVTVFQVSRTLNQGATDIVHQWQTIAYKLPNEIFIRAMPLKTEETVTVLFYGMYLGEAKRFNQILRHRFPKLGLETGDLKEMSWVESTLFWFGMPLDKPENLVVRPEESGDMFKRKSDYVKKVIPKEGLEKIWRKMIEMKGDVWMQWNPYGGRMSEISESETAFPHRKGNLFKIQYNTGPKDGVEGDYVNELREFYDLMTPYVSSDPRETFLNYRDIEVGTVDAEGYGLRYFKGNYKRLVDVKSRVDPENFFRNEQSIPPAKNFV